MRFTNGDLHKINLVWGFGNMITLSAVLHREDEVYVAECPEVGTVSQGKTVEEAIENLKEATELYLEEFPLKTN